MNLMYTLESVLFAIAFMESVSRLILSAINKSKTTSYDILMNTFLSFYYGLLSFSLVRVKI